jgi:YegS/Rv2252/BmrU family lipid kinase
MNDSTNLLKILFIVNPRSGKTETNWVQTITDHFNDLSYQTDILQLEEDCDPKIISKKIDEFKPNRVVAVGGDGTVKLVAEQLLDKPDIELGILPAGSANGMAKELGIPQNPTEALELIVSGEPKKIHLVKVNDHICIHLADAGFNAFVIKMFEKAEGRGMWGYVKASWKALWQHSKLNVKIKTDDDMVQRQAAMIVIGNATKYGSGALINPEGKLDDALFEVIVVRKISFTEIFKMMVTHMAYNPEKTEVFQCTHLIITSKKHAHFQVDGEYLGKTNKVEAGLLPAAISIVVPKTTKE